MHSMLLILVLNGLLHLHSPWVSCFPVLTIPTSELFSYDTSLLRHGSTPYQQSFTSKITNQTTYLNTSIITKVLYGGLESNSFSPTTNYTFTRSGWSDISVTTTGPLPKTLYTITVDSSFNRQLHLGERNGPVLSNVKALNPMASSIISFSANYLLMNRDNSTYGMLFNVTLEMDRWQNFAFLMATFLTSTCTMGPYVSYFTGPDSNLYVWRQKGFAGAVCKNNRTGEVIASYRAAVFTAQTAGELQIKNSAMHMRELLITTSWLMDRNVMRRFQWCFVGPFGLYEVYLNWGKTLSPRTNPFMITVHSKGKDGEKIVTVLHNKPIYILPNPAQESSQVPQLISGPHGYSLLY